MQRIVGASVFAIIYSTNAVVRIPVGPALYAGPLHARSRHKSGSTRKNHSLSRRAARRGNLAMNLQVARPGIKRGPYVKKARAIARIRQLPPKPETNIAEIPPRAQPKLPRCVRRPR